MLKRSLIGYDYLTSVDKRYSAKKNVMGDQKVM